MQERIRQKKGMLQLQQKVRKKMKGRKIRIRQGVKGWLLALAMVVPLQRLEAGRLCTAESEQLVQFDAGRGYGQKRLHRNPF